MENDAQLKLSPDPFAVGAKNLSPRLNGGAQAPVERSAAVEPKQFADDPAWEKALEIIALPVICGVIYFVFALLTVE